MCNCDNNFSHVEAAKSVSSAVKTVFKTVTTFYNPIAPPDLKKERMKICIDCEAMTLFLGKKRCGICSCFVDPKTSLIDQSCPKQKW